MVSPLTPLDEALIEHRGIARRVAQQLATRFPGCDFEDLEAACWVGVAGGLASHDDARGRLIRYLFYAAKHAGVMYVRKWARRGFRCAPIDVASRVLPITDAVHVVAERAADPWRDEEWERALSPLSGKVACVFEMRFRRGLDYEDIASELGYASTESVRVTIAKNAPKLTATVERET